MGKKKHLRILSFVGVLILSGALLTGLFQGAQAADMSVTNAPSSPSGQATFTFQISIPDGQEVPIDRIEAIVEKKNPDREGKEQPILSARVSCPFNPSAGFTCTESGSGSDVALRVDGGSSGIVTKIELTRVFNSDTGDDLEVGYSADCSQAGYCNFDSSGYGYDGEFPSASSDLFNSAGYGYGYGYETGRISSSAGDTTSGQGYGYGGGTLVFQFDATVDTSQLETGVKHWFTGAVETRSSVVGHFSTPFTAFTPTTAGGGNAGPGGGGGGGGGAGAGVIETGLDRAFTVSQNQRVKIINGLPSNFQSVLVKFNRQCQGCSISMTTHGGSPPAGTPPVPDGARVLPSTYFTLEVLDSDGNVVEGAISGGSMEFTVPQSKLSGDTTPDQVSLMHHKDGSWIFEETTRTSGADADPHAYNGTLSSFSVFATAVDTQKPRITNPSPTGDTNAVTPQISADFSDNRGIDADSFELTIDGQAATGDTGSLQVDESGFTYVPGTQLEKTTHDIEAKVSDDSGLTTTRSWSFRVVAEECPNPPQITNVKPADGATDVALDAKIEVTIQLGSCPIKTSSLSVNGDSVQSTLTDGTLTATLPSDVTTDETVQVTATVTDQADNVDRRSWSFTTTQQADGGPTDGGEDGGGGLVWVIVALVVLAVIGVGAYFYTQQEGGSGGAGGRP